MNHAAPEPLRFLSFDVEEYFHIEAARGVIERRQWPNWPSRVEPCVERLLDLLACCGRRATFFILGDVARRRRALVRRIADAGHEIACHGMLHDRLHRLTCSRFRDDVLASRRLLEDIVGQGVTGYRAPCFSVTRATAWAIDILLEAGFTWDSSIFPVRHPHYGLPGAPLEPFRVRGTRGGGEMLEVPPLVWRVAGRRVPVAGGAYFRWLPLGCMRRGLTQAQRECRPAMLYFHPWEFDPDQPRMPLPRLQRWRTYTGLGRTMDRLERVLRLPGRWCTVSEALPELEKQAAQQRAFVISEGSAETGKGGATRRYSFAAAPSAVRCPLPVAPDPEL